MLKRTALPSVFFIGTFFLFVSIFVTCTRAHASYTAPQSTVGNIPGDFAVVNGAATYSIPIAVAPGRGGMQPDLSLNYASGSGNGILGMGWSLGGQSVIHRCPRTIAQDGMVGGINFNANDRYCLDGQRLIPIRGANGGVNTEYRTEVDGYSKITSYGGWANNPVYWEVKTKAGQVMRFGGHHGSATHRVSQGKVSWSIREINDTTGENPITFEYFIDQNTPYLQEIRYAGGSVTVHYESRPDIQTAYFLGNRVVKSKRIKHIETFSGDPNPVLLQRYDAQYNNDGYQRLSKLKKLRACTVSECIEDVDFSWTHVDLVDIPHHSINGLDTFINDYSPAASIDISGINFGDFDGDGKTDIYLIRGWGGVEQDKIYLSRGNGAYDVINGLNTYVGNSVEGASIDISRIKFMDFNADGKTDIYLINGSGSVGQDKIYLSKGDGTYDVINGLDTFINSYSPAASIDISGINFGDFNGDGLTDIYLIRGWGAVEQDKIYLSRGNGTYDVVDGLNTYVGNSAESASVDISSMKFMDFNADGKTDIYLINGWGNAGQDKIYLSKGDGTYDVINGLVTFISGYISIAPIDISRIKFGDFDGDGLTDIYLINGWGGILQDRIYKNNQNQLHMIAISNSEGATTHLSYKPLTDPSVYTKGSGAQFPVRDIKVPQYVVSQVQTSNGIGGTSTVQYHYEGLKAHIQGRGSYGYAKITETYPETGKQKITTFDQSGFPLSGTVKKVQELYHGKRINEATHTMVTDSHYPGVYQLNFRQSFQQSFELGNDTTPVTTVTTTHSNIDAYGNIGRILVETSGGGETFTKITNSYYYNDISRWHLGRLTHSTVTHQSPYSPDEQRRSEFTYDETGLLLTEAITNADNTQTLTTTTYTYDAYGQKTQVRVSALGETDRVSTTTYDSAGRPTQSCNALNQCETRTYTYEGWLASITGPNGITTAWTHDAFGRNIRTDRADGTWSTIARHFTSSGQCGDLAAYAYTCTIAQSAGSGPVIVQFDALGRELRKIKTGFDGRLVYSDTEYNHLSQVTRVSRDYFLGDHIYWANSQYDALGRVIQLDEPGPHGSRNLIITEYNGLVTTVRSEQRAKTTYTNALGQKTKIEEEGTHTEYTYNSAGNLLTTQVAGDNATVIRLSYDAFGRKIAMDDPDMGRWSYQYNAFGQLIAQTDAKGQTTTMTYDILGRMISRTEPEGTSTWVYGDNSAPAGSLGKLLQESGHGLTKAYFYDNLGRPTRTTTTIAGQGSFTNEVSYDEFGRTKRTTYPGTQGFFTENVYNQQGFLEAVTGLRSQAEAHDYTQLQPLISSNSR